MQHSRSGEAADRDRERDQPYGNAGNSEQTDHASLGNVCLILLCFEFSNPFLSWLVADLKKGNHRFVCLASLVHNLLRFVPSNPCHRR